MITKEQKDKLTQVYNTLLKIETKGENTLIMADCIRVFHQTLQEIQMEDIKTTPVNS